MKIFITILMLISVSFASVVEQYLISLKQEVQQENPDFSGFDAKKGEEIFTSKHIGKKGKSISCTSCHGTDFTQSHKNFFTGKVIEPLSPKANPKRFSEIKSIKKWLRRNFNDVYSREGTAQEKGDVVTYILSKDKK